MDDSDPYVYPDTTILKNRWNVRDAVQLNEFEAEITAARMRDAIPNVPMTPDGYRALHRHIFQDIYPWAGDFRACQLGKPYWFEEAKNIDRRMAEQFGKLNAENDLRSLRPRQFAERAAEHLCELNDIHPFREGNGRTNRLFAQLLADQAGLRLRMSAIRREEWMNASIVGFHKSDYEPMTQILRKAVASRQKEISRGLGM